MANLDVSARPSLQPSGPDTSSATPSPAAAAAAAAAAPREPAPSAQKAAASFTEYGQGTYTGQSIDSLTAGAAVEARPSPSAARPDLPVFRAGTFDAKTLQASLDAQQAGAAANLQAAGAAEATAAPTTVKLPVDGQTQEGSACGTTSLSMVLKYYGVDSEVSDVGRIDDAIRTTSANGPLDSFTAPGDIAAYARDHGMQASVQTDASPEDIRAAIDQGTPPMILTDYSDPIDGSGLHYVVVNGYTEMPDGSYKYVVTNPQTGEEEELTEEELMAKWEDLSYNPKDDLGVDVTLDTGLNCVMITVAPTEGPIEAPDGAITFAEDLDLPPDDELPLSADFAAVLSDGLQALNEILALGQEIGTAIEEGAAATGDTVTYVVETIGETAENAYDYGEEKVNDATSAISDVGEGLLEKLL
ncbi:MAG: C39 family peptidase [Candidatus Schekmanbacteria bacterium]|nr:C39 family peptidase [Candidatus Schekmanbacteria bacterium]